MVEAGFSPKKLVYIPTFVSTKKIKINYENIKRQIVYLGRIDETKGVHILLKAIKILQEDNLNDFLCVIAGSGPYEYLRQLKTYIKKYNIKNVHFVGQLDKQELDKLLQKSLFSISPSIWYDNMPNSVLESLATGTPAIAPNHGSFPEIIKNGDTGLLFNPGDGKDLSFKISTLLDNEDMLRKMRQKARKYIKEKHSSEKHYESLINLCYKLID